PRCTPWRRSFSVIASSVSLSPMCIVSGRWSSTGSGSPNRNCSSGPSSRPLPELSSLWGSLIASPHRLHIQLSTLPYSSGTFKLIFSFTALRRRQSRLGEHRIQYSGVMASTTKDSGSGSRFRILSWALWDWGSAAFNAVIITFVFAPYLTKSVAATEEAGSSALGWSMAAAGFVIAVVAPAAGTRADSGGRHRLWLGV